MCFDLPLIGATTGSSANPIGIPLEGCRHNSDLDRTDNTNIVSNAAEAMANGGNITVKTRNRYLDKPVWGYDEVKEGDYVVLSISDTG